jgi:hypothetical protein
MSAVIDSRYRKMIATIDAAQRRGYSDLLEVES